MSLSLRRAFSNLPYFIHIWHYYYVYICGFFNVAAPEKYVYNSISAKCKNKNNIFLFVNEIVAKKRVESIRFQSNKEDLPRPTKQQKILIFYAICVFFYLFCVFVCVVCCLLLNWPEFMRLGKKSPWLRIFHCCVNKKRSRPFCPEGQHGIRHFLVHNHPACRIKYRRGHHIILEISEILEKLKRTKCLIHQMVKWNI